MVAFDGPLSLTLLELNTDVIFLKLLLFMNVLFFFEIQIPGFGSLQCSMVRNDHSLSIEHE